MRTALAESASVAAAVVSVARFVRSSSCDCRSSTRFTLSTISLIRSMVRRVAAYCATRSAVVEATRGSATTVKRRVIVSAPTISRTPYSPGGTQAPRSVPKSSTVFGSLFAPFVRRFQTNRLVPARVRGIESAGV